MLCTQCGLGRNNSIHGDKRRAQYHEFVAPETPHNPNHHHIEVKTDPGAVVEVKCCCGFVESREIASPVDAAKFADSKVREHKLEVLLDHLGLYFEVSR